MQNIKSRSTSDKYLGLLIFTIGVWVTLFWFISNANTKRTTPKDQASLIVTDPVNTIGLTSPVTIKFDIGENLSKKIPPELIRQINWDFDNDGEFDASGPSVIYEFLDKGTNNGRFPVQVEVVYFAADLKKEKTYSDGKEIIIANESVIADITANPLVGQAPLAVHLSGVGSRDPDGEIVRYEWDLDGDNSYEISGKDKTEVDTVFATIGEHTVRLRVTGTNKDFITAEKTVIAKAPDEKIRAQISSVDSSFKGLAPLEITLDGTQSFTKKGRIVKYQWQIEGEERSLLSRKIQRTFNRAGEYKITLTVENEDGDKDQASEIISVFERSEVIISTNPKPKGGSDTITGVVPFEVIFDSSLSEVPRMVEWRWDFENDQIIDEFGQKVVYSYRTPGEYEVKLTIIDSDNKKHEKIQKVIAESPGIQAEISANPSSGVVPLIVDFDGSGSFTSEGEIINYMWELPDTEPIYSSSNISREFRKAGTIPIKLTIIVDNGKTATTEKLISVREPVPEAHFGFSPRGGDAPLTVTFDGTDSKGADLDYTWDFGDGKTARTKTPVHEYPESGTYDIVLRVKNNQGVVSKTINTITVD